MRTRSIWTDISLAAILGLFCGSCTVKSSDGSTDAGGASMAIKCPSVTTPAPPAAGAPKAPCDIYADDGGPCVAAHSTVRALYATFGGALYQVKKADGTMTDVHALAPGGFANSAEQETFCGVDACTISTIYDQSGHGNHLTRGPAGMAKTTQDNEANAKAVSITINGHKVYGIHIVPGANGVGYRNNSACDTATGDEAETEYMVVAGDLQNSGCCFDYGNMERNSRDNGEGTMEAVYFGTCVIWGRGADNGPWVMGDLENGLWAGNISPYLGSPSLNWPFVTGLVKGDAPGKNHWTIKEGNATSGTLTMPFDGPRPSARYNPMRKEGAIGLGTGGDNSNAATGNWFEGVMTTTYSSDAADNAVQANIVAAYGTP